MIREEHGNLLRADVDALVNTVNTVGVMGKGIALQFKRAYPEMFKAYRRATEKNDIRIGEMFVWETGAITGPRFVINFPTKRHWRSPSRLQDISDGLNDLVQVIRLHKIKSIAIPPLGCGNGGLTWDEVEPLIRESLHRVESEVEIFIYPPEGAPPDSEMITAGMSPRMTPARAAVIKLMREYEEASFHEPTLIQVQKLVYFLQNAGENLRLEFAKGNYGPYADNLRKTIREIEGHFIIGFGDGNTKVTESEPLRAIDAAVEEAEKVLTDYPDTATRVDRVIALTEGFTSMYGLELLATVHWAVTHEHPRSRHEVVRLVRSWSKRKGSLFTEDHIEQALSQLETQNWLHPTAA